MNLCDRSLMIAAITITQSVFVCVLNLIHNWIISVLFETIKIRSCKNYFWPSSKACCYWVISANFHNIFDELLLAFLCWFEEIIIKKDFHKCMSYGVMHICISVTNCIFHNHVALNRSDFLPSNYIEFGFYTQGHHVRITCTRKWLPSRQGKHQMER